MLPWGLTILQDFRVLWKCDGGTGYCQNLASTHGVEKAKDWRGKRVRRQLRLRIIEMIVQHLFRPNQ